MKRIITLLATTLAATGIATGVGIARRRRALAPIPAELQSRALLVPMSIRGDTTMRIGRRLMAKEAPPAIAPTVQRRSHTVPATTGGPAVPVVIYERRDRAASAGASGALVWIHGGGLVMGTTQGGDGMCSRFADELGLVVVSVEYRLAPEHPFPAALDDCFAALAWVHSQADTLGIDASRIAVGGDSAGGGLAASLAQMAHDRGGPAICFQLLEYPMLDDRTSLRSDLDAFVWSNTSNRYAWSAYLGHAAGDPEPRPYAVPARRLDLRGLPPAWVGIGTIDLFHDECIDYATRLEAAGVPCELFVAPGMYHAADRLAPTAPSMIAFVESMMTALGTATSPG